MSTRALRTAARSALSATLALILALFAAPFAQAAPTISLSGPDSRGPIGADANGRFSFPNAALKRNSVNRFTVTATDDAGRTQSKDVVITQLSLESVVVSKVTATPIPPERVIQLVNDGVIDLDDPSNFNVSTFAIVLTIGGRELPIEVPVGVSNVVEETGSENLTIPSDPGGGGSSRVEDTEIVVFDQVVPGPPGVPAPRIPGVIVIDGAIKSLKEFFSVRLLLMNMSGIFTLSDVKASLEFPDGGLSPTLPADGVAAFDEILPGDGDVPGQKEREFIVRGDEIGRRAIRVNFGGFVTGPGIPEDAPIPFSGAADTGVEVKGPPQFRVRVSHPASVVQGVPYELGVEITNAGEAAALFASLELDVGAAAKIVDCTTPAGSTTPVCTDAPSPVVRNLRHLFPGDIALEKFTILPSQTGPITSCVGASDQNVTLEVLVGTIGCITGHFPPPVIGGSGEPTVTVLPFANAQGIGVDSPVTALFSESMDETSLAPAIRVRDAAGSVLSGSVDVITLRGRSIAIWQYAGGALPGNARFDVEVTTDAKDLGGASLATRWTSSFHTTSSTADVNPPTLTLGFEPGISPLAVLPGQIVRVNAYAADQGSGLARIELRMKDSDDPAAQFELIDQKTIFDLAVQGPIIFSIDSAMLAPGHAFQLQATAFDVAGNLQDATLPFALAASSVPPSIALPADPVQPVLQGVSVALTPQSVSPAVRRVTFVLDGAATPLATLTIAPFAEMLSTIALPLGAHVVTAIAEDGLGQTAQDTLSFTLVDNPSEPRIDFGAAVDGAVYTTGSTFSVLANANDDTGLRDVVFALDDETAATPLLRGVGAVSIDTSTLSAGVHRLYGVATNLLGKRNDPTNPDSYLEFSVRTPPNGPPPAAPTIASIGAPAGGKVTLSGQAPAPFARVDLTNATRGLSLSVTADASGAWSATIDGDVGDAISAVAFDFDRSQQASAATASTVPAPPALASLTLAPATSTLTAVGAFVDLAVTGHYSDGSSASLTAQASFSSNAPGVASVGSTGRVAAIANGDASITASVGATQASASIAVRITTLQSLSVNPSSVTLDFLDATAALQVTGHYSDGSSRVLPGGVSFASTAPGVATVTPAGLVRAVGPGAATVLVAVSGLAPVSVPVNVAADAVAPVVAITTPADGTGVERGDLVGVIVQASDGASGVARTRLDVSGAATFAEERTIAPPAPVTSTSFAFAVPGDAAMGAGIDLVAGASDGSGNASSTPVRRLVVVDRTAPSVVLDAPLADTIIGLGEVLQIDAHAGDAVGITRLRYEITGAFTASGETLLPAEPASATASFEVSIPTNLTSPDVRVRVFARDAAGNEGASTNVPIVVRGADTTPPATEAVLVTPPQGASPIVQVAWTITGGGADFDHVLLYFRRDGLGTFSRYTNAAGGNPNGEFAPASASGGTIDFDATRMGGDGVYEFATVGVDHAGNHEPLPTDGTGAVIGDSVSPATVATGAPVTEITADTEIVGAGFDDRSLRIRGATVTLVGRHAFRNVELLQGAVLTHRETTASVAYGLELDAWTISIDAASRIDVTGRGHLGGGRGGANGNSGDTTGFAQGAASGNGGSYGGVGGHYGGSGANAPNPVYGDLTNPVDLGSGGGEWGGSGADGGGRALIGAINLVVDGAVRADGAVSSGSASGEGSGGSVNLTLRTLSGRGTLEADGGTTAGANHTGGGGGRIAVRYLDLVSYDVAKATARGGDGHYGDGADGSVYLLGESETSGTLVLSGSGNANAPYTDLILPPGQQFDSIVLTNVARVIANGAIDLAGDLRLTQGSILTHPSASEAGLQITAERVVIEPGSAIDVTGRGYRGGSTSGSTQGNFGETLAFAPGSGPGTGGSHGGPGGAYSGSPHAPGLVYGDPLRPTTLGGGGGEWGGAGAGGGGAVRLAARDQVIVDGEIRANGAISSGSASGEGAGGSIWITTGRLAGLGAVRADGGTTAGGNHSAGGGGRVAIEADFVDPAADLIAARRVTARGGDGHYADGAPGTLFFRVGAGAVGDLVIDQGLATGTWPITTTLPFTGPGVATGATADTLALDGALAQPPAGALVGLRLNPDLAQRETFAIAASDPTTIRVITPNEHGIDFAVVAQAGDRYGLDWPLENLVLRGGVRVDQLDAWHVANEIAVTERSVLSHPSPTQPFRPGVELFADRVRVDATSAIDVSGRGYPGGGTSIFGIYGVTEGFVQGAGSGNGGSHGGVGGHWSGSSSTTNSVYGSFTDPLDYGAGGGEWSGAGAAGGGRVRIVATELQVDGAIRADGGVSSGSASGEGAGGSVNVQVVNLLGAGTIEADGGSTGNVNHSGGGGGRIALRTSGVVSLPGASVHAVGGDGWYADGGHGTVFLLGAGQTHGTLVIDGQGFAVPDDTTVLPAGLVFDDLELRGAARVVADAGVTVVDELRLAGGSRLLHSSRNEAGLVIDAARVVVEAGSAIDVSGRGYAGGGQSAHGGRGETLGLVPGAQSGHGGTHGGRGGRYAPSAAGVLAPYGDPFHPTTLGSGGGEWSGAGASGGGAIRLRATDSVRIDGSVLANGAVSSGSASGEGAGGSIWITTPLLAGTGAIRADGGTAGNTNHTGGGGGRIALEVGTIDPIDDFASLAGVTVQGGDGWYGDAGDGSLVVIDPATPNGHWILDGGFPSTGTDAMPAELPPVGPGVAQSVGADELTVDGAVLLPPAGGLAGARINPDLSQSESFAIAGHDATTIRVITPNEHGVHFASVAQAGERYAADWRFDRVTMRNGAQLALFDPLTVTGELAITTRSWLTHAPTTGAYEGDLDVTAATITVDATSRIDVSDRGYLGGNRGGNHGGVADTLGFAAGAGLGAGGSYGGLGGDYAGNGASVPNPVYGSATDPRELGSGGGEWSGPGGNGGGRVRLVAGSIVVEGSIFARGGTSAGSASGEGSGGSINLLADVVAGSGVIDASGGTANGSNHTGGGGGRLAIRALQSFVFPLANLFVAGGDGYYADGAPGTTWVEAP